MPKTPKKQNSLALRQAGPSTQDGFNLANVEEVTMSYHIVNQK